MLETENYERSTSFRANAVLFNAEKVIIAYIENVLFGPTVC